MANNEVTARFAGRIRQLREMKSLSQAGLARNVKFSQSTVAAWELGQREPTLQGLQTLADFFGVPVDYLLGRTDTPLQAVQEGTPFAQVTPFERQLLDQYRELLPEQQAMVCRLVGLEHPAESRLKAKKSS